MAEVTSQGSMSIEFRPPDVLIVEYSGLVDGQIVRSARLNSREHLHGLPHFLMVFDVRRLDSLTADARRAIVEKAPHGIPPARAIAVIGANFRTRAVVSMLSRAWQFFHSEDSRPVQFFDSMDDIHRWFDVRRSELAQSMPRSD